MEAYLKSVSVYFPEKVLSNSDLSAAFPEWSVDKIGNKTGIENRHIAAEDEFVSSMAIKAALKLFAENNINPATIDFVILCTQSPDYFLPTTACILQHELGIPSSAGAFDFNLGCSGYVYGLGIAKGLISAGIAKNILFLTAETYSKFIHPSDKSNRTIFGDAASASLITSEECGAKIGSFVLGTDGKGAQNLIVKRGGVKYARTSDESFVMDEYGNARNDNYLYMNGPEIFNFTSQMVPLLIEDILLKTNLTIAEIDTFIFHQANSFMLNHLRKKIGIPVEKFYLDMHDCGNTVCSTIPIGIDAMYKANKFSKNDKVILAGFGVGYSWGACLLEIV